MNSPNMDDHAGNTTEENRHAQLSLMSVWNRICCTTRPSNSEPHNTRQAESIQQASFKQLGKGQCGTVWQISRGQVIKLMNDGKKDQLWNDCCMHKRVEEAFQDVSLELRMDINLPAFGTWIRPSTTAFWSTFRDQSPMFGLISDQIMPVPYALCEELVDRFAPRSVQRDKHRFLMQQHNQDCLIRIYLGRRTQRHESEKFRLRNFDLRVHEMETLGLDTMSYAKILARTLAILHWKAGTDANDIEFVIGRAPRIKSSLSAIELVAAGPNHSLFTDAHIAPLAVWVLDFNQCEPFSETLEGVTQLMKAFYFNDPYYPRPISRHPNDVALWDTFKAVYLEASAKLTETELPRHFIKAVENEGKKRSAGGSLFI